MEHTVEYVLFSGTMGLDVTGPLEVFTTATALLAQQQRPNAGYAARFVAARKGPVRLSSGAEMVANADFSTAGRADMLLVPGGDGIGKLAADQNFIAYLQQRIQQVGRVMSVCKGAFLLAATGILQGKSATTHWLVADELARRYPGIKVESDAIFTCEDQIYTSAGVTTGIDLALAVVEEDYGAPVAMEVARLLVMYYRRPGAQSQFSSPLAAQEQAGRRFAELHQWLIAHLQEAITVDQMAEFVAMSPRTFARTFKLETGTTPSRYLEVVRLDRAREVMMGGDVSLATVAEVSGFGREERLRRAFGRRFGVTPSQYRQHFVVGPEGT